MLENSDNIQSKSSEFAVKASTLTKVYHLYDNSRDRLKEALHPKRKKYHQDFYALRNISFEVGKGETIGILGQNGSGKTTLLKILSNVLTPSGGSYIINGKVSSLLELGTGFNPELTGIENVYFNGTLLGFTPTEMDAKMDSILSFADIGQFVRQPVKTYSSGMYVRLAFSVASHVDPDIFIIDEALAVGDEKFQRKCYGRLEGLKQRGTTILLVSHSIHIINEFCDKAILLDHGRLLMYGSPTETIRAYQKLMYTPGINEDTLDLESNAKNQKNDDKTTTSASDLKNPFSEFSSESYDSNLIPETTMVYPLNGAKIEFVKILDQNGQIVNVLKKGGTYSFVVSGFFLSSLDSVSFGIHIRSVSGTTVSGQRYPVHTQFLTKIEAARKFSVQYTFRMNIVPNVYFISCGVWAMNETSCAHRIMDVLMIRVVSDENHHSFGYADLSAKNPILELT